MDTMSPVPLTMQPIDANNQVAGIHVEPPSKEPLSPIHSLPYELLAKILILTLRVRCDKGGRVTSASPGDVLVLCRVCGHWRQVALATPRLWVADHFPVIVRNLQMFTVTKMFLERSAPLPIPVFIHPFIHVRDTPDLLPILVSAAHRWRDFNLEYDMENFDMGLLARALAGNLETLEKLRLALHNLDFEVDVFLSAPRLRDVTIEVEGVSSNLLPMPWAQLTRLSLSYDSPQLCLDILAGCKNLVSANILTDQWLATDSPDVSATGILDHLEKLTIFMRICSTGEHLGPFLRRLRLPALKSLSLTLALLLPVNSEWFISWVAPTMISFLIRSPNIECLSVANCVSAEDMQDVLQYTPFLTRLTFSDRAVDDTFFAALRYSATGPIQLAPKLEVLELFDVGVDFTEKTFAEMIRSRWSASPGVARLKRVNLQNYLLGPKHFTEEFAEMMEGCRSQGLELDVY